MPLRKSFHPTDDLPRLDVSRPFPARFASVCKACGERFEEGTEIVRIGDNLFTARKPEYVHAGECAEEYAG